MSVSSYSAVTLLTSCLMLAGSSSCIEPLANTEVSSQPIIGGLATTAYPAVAQITTITSTGAFSCSSTLITSRVLITAAHCIDVGAPVDSITAYFGTSSFNDSMFIERIPAAKWVFKPNWFVGGDDIALVLLAYDSVVTPMTYNSTSLGTGDIGRPLHVVGWGNNNKGTGGGTKREVTIPITGFGGNDVLEYGNSSANTCQGDSGGPGFVSFGGIERVSSISSFVRGGCFGSSGGTMVDRHTSFIANWIAKNDVPTPPVVELVAPIEGQEVGSRFRVQVTATDEAGIDRVEVWLNGELSQTLDGAIPPYVTSTPEQPDGTVIVEVRVFDNRDEMTSESVTVTVDTICDGPQDCSGVMLCESGACVDPNYELGQDCSFSEECGSSLCVTLGDEQRCTASCSPSEAGSCLAGYECLALEDDTGLCWQSEESGGCNSSGTSGTSGTSGGIIFLLLAVAIWGRHRFQVLR